MNIGKTNKLSFQKGNNIVVQDVKNSSVEIILDGSNRNFPGKIDHQPSFEEKLPFDSSLAEEIYERAIVAKSQADYRESYKLLHFFIVNFNVKKANRYQLNLLANIYYLFSDILMQLGIRDGPLGAFKIASTAEKYYKMLSDVKGQSKSCHIIALCYRQMCAYKKAQKLFFKSYKLVEHLQFATHYRMHILHDIAENSFLLASKMKNPHLFDFSRKCFEKSNSYFKIEDPVFYNIALIKTADLHIKEGNINLSNDCLSSFEDTKIYNNLTVPFKAIFLRTNAERYFIQDEFEKGLNFFVKGIKLNKKENYKHQMEELLFLRRKFADELIDSLPSENDMYNAEIFSL